MVGDTRRSRGLNVKAGGKQGGGGGEAATQTSAKGKAKPPHQTDKPNRQANRPRVAGEGETEPPQPAAKRGRRRGRAPGQAARGRAGRLGLEGRRDLTGQGAAQREGESPGVGVGG